MTTPSAGGPAIGSRQVAWMFELAVKAGREPDFRALMAEMAEATDRNEPGTLDYEWYVSDDGLVADSPAINGCGGGPTSRNGSIHVRRQLKGRYDHEYPCNRTDPIRRCADAPRLAVAAAGG